jgi:hypothetical protein
MGCQFFKSETAWGFSIRNPESQGEILLKFEKKSRIRLKILWVKGKFGIAGEKIQTL